MPRSTHAPAGSSRKSGSVCEVLVWPLTVQDGKEAVDYYRKHGQNIDLVLLDMSMPIMDGADCFRELKKLDREVMAILSTGFALNSDAQELLDEGALGFVQKPFVMAELAETLAKAIAE